MWVSTEEKLFPGLVKKEDKEGVLPDYVDLFKKHFRTLLKID